MQCGPTTEDTVLGLSSTTSPDQVIAIIAEDKIYKVNKKQLIEKSDYFRALYSSGMRESTEDSVQLQGLSIPGLEQVLEFINTAKVQVVNETLEDLIATASFLQVTSILKLLTSEIRQDNCVELYRLSQVYGAHDLHGACLKYMSCYYHPMLRQSEFRSLPSVVRDQVREMRMKGTATLVATGDFKSLSLDVPDQEEPWSMLRYDEAEQRWKPLANNRPPDTINVRGYGSAVLDNYLFVVGGTRITNHEISAVHCYNPSRNEWNQVAPLNQSRSNFKLLAVQGKLYAVGGESLSLSLTTVECYSPELDLWTCVSAMPEPLGEFSACQCQGMIYVLGGYTELGRNTKVIRYCPASDTWASTRSGSTHVRKQQMLSVEDTVYVVGGFTHELRPWRRPPLQTQDGLVVQSYNVATGAWAHLKQDTCRSGLNLTCTLHNDGIYIMSRDVGLHSRAEDRVSLKYNIFSDAWEAFRRLPGLGKNMLLCSLYLPNML